MNLGASDHSFTTGRDPLVHETYPDIYPILPLSSLVIFFDWNQLAKPRLPSNTILNHSTSLQNDRVWHNNR